MATTVEKIYVWPPNFIEGTDTMSGNMRRIKVAVNGSTDDGQDDSGVLVIDKSDLLGPDRSEPSSLAIEGIEWNIGNFDAIILEWDHTTNDTIYIMTGDQEVDWRSYGALQDPNEGDGTGDIVISTEGGNAGDRFSLTICAKLKQ